MKAKKLQFFKKNLNKSLNHKEQENFRSKLRCIKSVRVAQDKFLILKTKHGNENAYAKIYDVYVKEIYRFIYLKVASQEEAEDITHEVFIKGWQYIKNGSRAIKNLKAFLYQIARNLVIDYYRKKKPLAVDDKQIAQLVDKKSEQKIEQSFDNKQKFENLEQALLKIKDQHREVLVLKFIQELSISEIAKILNKSKGAVRVLIHRALKELRRVMEG